MKPNESATERVSELDGLRGIAISLVLWHHLIAPFFPLSSNSFWSWLRAGTSLAWAGVDLFFVLSGFFIGGILIDHRASPKLARVFYLRRALRILPLYYMTLLVAFAFIWLGMPLAQHQFSPAVYGLFLTNFGLAHTKQWDWLALSVLWSIAVEEQFYLVAPWVVRVVKPPSLPWCALGLFVSAWVVRLIVHTMTTAPHLAEHVLMPTRMDALATGIGVAWAVRSTVTRTFFQRLRRFWICSWILAGVALACVTVLQSGGSEDTLSWIGYSLLARTGGLVVATVAGARPAGSIRTLSFGPLVHLGRRSYFIYLWHALIGTTLIRALGGADFSFTSHGGILIVGAAVGATWIAASLSFKLFEQPILSWGRKYAY